MPRWRSFVPEVKRSPNAGWPRCAKPPRAIWKLRQRIADVGIPLLQGLIAFCGDYARVVDLLHPVRFELFRIGGSHAQRDIFDWTLTEAACRSKPAGCRIGSCA